MPPSSLISIDKSNTVKSWKYELTNAVFNDAGTFQCTLTVNQDNLVARAAVVVVGELVHRDQ